MSREKDVALRKHVQENESLNFRNQQVSLKGTLNDDKVPRQNFVCNFKGLAQEMFACTSTN